MAVVRTYHIGLVPCIDTIISYNERVKKDLESILYNICTEQDYKIHGVKVIKDYVNLCEPERRRFLPTFQV